MPPFMKPLLLSNGQPLILHAIEHALTYWNPSRLCIVAGPENAKALCSVVGHRYEIYWVLQPKPRGVVDAVVQALPLCDTTWTLILCADNVFETGKDAQAQIVDPQNAMIAIRTDIEEERFTKLQLSNETATVVRRDETAWNAVWIGPVLLRTTELKKAVKEADGVDEMLMRAADEYEPLVWQCADLGIPEAIS